MVNGINKAIITKETNDNEEVIDAQVFYNGKTKDINLIIPYGLIANPPKDSDVVTFACNNNEEELFGIAISSLTRKKELKEGETGLYNHKTKSYILLNKDKEVVCKSENEIILQSLIDIRIKSDLHVEGVIYANDIITDGGTW